ncbi:MAG TPA: M48 family metalloprotease [Planctomycetota bacterium]|nr:M48 family metalloprotease [Planctomycetota bacterium]
MPAAPSPRQERPAADASAAPPASAAGPGILEAFTGDLPSISVPIHYRAGLALVAVAMVLLPMVYLGIIVLVGYLLFRHVTNIPAIFGELHNAKGALLVAFGPLAVGGVLLLFMVKPLFAPKSKSRRLRELRRADEPLLFAFVERLCRAVGAPVPRAIQVDHEVNASASFRRGLISMLGSDLQLCIGLPLAGGLTLRQFAGVLAHEFGHFAQAGGMRLTYVIRTVNAWFARVVYERDAWDDRLVAWSKEIDIRIGVVFYLARGMVWLTRRILWVLMWIGHLISCFMLRQMEFDADRYEAWLAGSGNFAETARRLPLLSIAASKTQSELSESWDEGRLADDYPGMVVLNYGRMPEEIRTKVEKEVAGRRTGFFDTHPADADRVASAARMKSAGTFRPDDSLPAAALFADFRGLCREVSFELYRAAFGGKVDRAALVPVAELERRQGAEQEAVAAMGRFFQGKVSAMRPLNLPLEIEPLGPDPKAVALELRDRRQEMVAAVPAYSEQFRHWDDLDTRGVKAGQARALLEANFRIDPQAFHLPAAKLETTRAAEKVVREKMMGLEAGLAAFETAAGRRIAAALRLLAHPSVAAKLGDAEALRAEAADILPAARALFAATPKAVELRDQFQAAVILLNNLEGNQENPALIAGITSRMRTLSRGLEELLKALGDARYPLDHADKQKTLRAFILPFAPGSENIGELMGGGGDALNRFFNLNTRLTARLALIAERVEEAVGLQRLSEPKKDEEQKGAEA